MRAALIAACTRPTGRTRADTSRVSGSGCALPIASRFGTRLPIPVSSASFVRGSIVSVRTVPFGNLPPAGAMLPVKCPCSTTK